MKCFHNTLVIITALCLSFISCQNKKINEELAIYEKLESKEASNIDTVKQFYIHLDKFLNEQERNALMNMWSSDSKRFGGSSDESMSMQEMTPFLTSWYTAFQEGDLWV
jgi:hypothetical protein